MGIAERIQNLERAIRGLGRLAVSVRSRKRPNVRRYSPPAPVEIDPEYLQVGDIGKRIRWIRGGGRGKTHHECQSYEGEIVALILQGESARTAIKAFFPGQKITSCNKDRALKNDRWLIRKDSGKWALLAFEHASLEFIKKGSGHAYERDQRERKYLRRPGLPED